MSKVKVSSKRRPRSKISLTEKLDIIYYVNKHPDSKRADIAKELGINTSTLNRIVQTRNDILNATTQYGSESSCRKNIKFSPVAKLETQLLEWITSLPPDEKVNGTHIRQRACTLAEEQNILNFKASNGWLHRFKKRNSLDPLMFASRRGSQSMAMLNSIKKKDEDEEEEEDEEEAIDIENGDDEDAKFNIAVSSSEEEDDDENEILVRNPAVPFRKRKLSISLSDTNPNLDIINSEEPTTSANCIQEPLDNDIANGVEYFDDIDRNEGTYVEVIPYEDHQKSLNSEYLEQNQMFQFIEIDDVPENTPQPVVARESDVLDDESSNMDPTSKLPSHREAMAAFDVFRRYMTSTKLPEHIIVRLHQMEGDLTYIRGLKNQKRTKQTLLTEYYRKI